MSHPEKRGVLLWVLLAVAACAISVAAFLILSGGGPPVEPEKAPNLQPAANQPAANQPAMELGSATSAVPGAARSEAAPTAAKPAVAPVVYPAAYEKALAGLTGRIVEPSGEPVAGARVELIGGMMEMFTANLNTLLFDPESFEPELIQQKITTDASGKFHFTKVDPRLFHMLGVNLGYGRPQLRIVDQLPNPGSLLNLGDIALDPPLQITGRVVKEAGGKPIAGAHVRITALPKVVFDAGIANVSPESTIMFRAGSMGTHLWRMPKWMRNYWEKLPFATGTTGADGTFKIDGAPAGELTLVVNAPGYPPATHRVPPAGSLAKDAGDVVVPTGETVEGVVVDESNQAIANAEVMPGIICLLANELVFLQKPLRTDAAGHFNATGLVGKKFRAAARAPGHTSWTYSNDLEISGDEVTIKVPGAKSITVTVADESGKPGALKMASVLLQMRDGPGMFPQLFPPSRVQLHPLEPGKYRVDGLRTGKFVLYAMSDGYATSEANFEIRDTGETIVPVTLKPEHYLRVSVTGRDGTTFVPLELATIGVSKKRVNIERTGYFGVSTGQTNRDGKANLRSIGEGAYWVGATHPGYAATSVAIKFPETQEVTFQLLRGGTIKGRVHDSGKPIEKPILLTCTYQDGLDGEKLEPMAFPRLAVVADDGSFEFTHLTPGTHEIEQVPMRFGDQNLAGTVTSLFSSRMMFVERMSREVVVKDEEVSEVDIDINKKRESTAEDGRIHGTVMLNGAAYADAGIMIYGSEFKQLKTDAAGNFDTGPIRAGDWVQVHVQERSPTGSWSQLASKTVQLKPGEDREVRFDLKAGGPVRGIVKSAATGKPLASAFVQMQKIVTPVADDPSEIVIQGDHSSLSQRTDASGSFTFEVVPEGQFNIGATARGYARSVQVKVSVLAGTSNEPVVILLPDGVTVSGSIQFEGNKKSRYTGLSFTAADGGPENFRSEWAQVTDDKFSVDTLVPGKYNVDLQVWGQDSDEANLIATSQFEPMELTVPPGGLRDITLSFASKKKSQQAPAPASK